MQNDKRQPTTLAGLVVEIGAKAKADTTKTRSKPPVAVLDALVNVACAHPASAEAEAVVRILGALAKPEAAHSFDRGILEVLSPTTIRDLDALIGDMLDGHCSDQELRGAVRRVRIRRVK